MMEPNILVMQREHIVLSSTGEHYGKADAVIASILLTKEAVENCYICGVNMYPVLADLNLKFTGSVSGWKMRISSKSRTGTLKDGRLIRSGSFFVDYFCIEGHPTGSKRQRKWIRRKRIDVMNLELLLDHPPINPGEQYRLALYILELQEKRGLKFARFTRGAIGAALLKASPHWEKGRHAAPKFINRFSRAYLPGNYYAVSKKTEDEGRKWDHLYLLDQSSAHHSIASQITIPHPHYIRGRGFCREAQDKNSRYKVWCKADSELGRMILSGEMIGLFYCRIAPMTLPPTKEHLYPPCVKKRDKYVWLWTPDIRLLQNDKRFQLDSFMAGFGCRIGDPVISEYAEWSLDYLRENDRAKIFTKSTLLAAYGMLAFDNDKYKSVTKYWGGGVKGTKVFLPRAGTVTERTIQFRKHTQHNVVNVIARGLIESETRARTLEYAKELDSQETHIAQVYADAILVSTNYLSFVRPGWRVAESLTNVRIPRPNAFESDQVTKLPGVSRQTEEDIIFIENKAHAFSPLNKTHRGKLEFSL